MFPRRIFQQYELSSQVLRRSIYASPIMLDKNESKLKGYAMTGFMRYMKRYEQMLEKRYPSAMNVYRVFTDGIKTFYQDLKMFFKVRYLILGDENLNTLTRKQIELYDQMPRDMLKIAPVLLLSTLPLANYVIFPLAYMYPHKFLTSHFWSAEQKEKFYTTQLNKRTHYYKSTLKCLKGRFNTIKDQSLLSSWSELVKNLEIGQPPSLEHLNDCKSLFNSGPYGINNLQFRHSGYLMRLHGMTPFLTRQTRLWNRAIILKEMDQAIIREGGLDTLSSDILKHLCYIRGLDMSKLNQDEILALLNKWVSLSDMIDTDNYSLLLHAPMLMGFHLLKTS